MITPYDRLKTRREEAENKAPQKDPTLLDWEEVIIPELRRFLYRTNAAHYEIEEWVRRVRAQMMLGNEKALLFVAKEILGGNRPSSKILPYFPLHLRERNYSLYRQSEPQEAGLLTSEVHPQPPCHQTHSLWRYRLTECYVYHREQTKPLKSSGKSGR